MCDPQTPAVSGTETLTVPDATAMHRLGERIGAQLRVGDTVLLTGPLGAGKTTLTRGIGDGLGVRGPVTSPTFVLARSHPNLGSGPGLVHVDAYRLHDSAELEDLDLDFTHSVVVIEWGDNLVDTGDSWLHVVIERPQGAGVAAATADDTDGVAAAAAEDSASATADDVEEVGDSPEPRTVTLTAYGQRWADAPLCGEVTP